MGEQGADVEPRTRRGLTINSDTKLGHWAFHRISNIKHQTSKRDSSEAMAKKKVWEKTITSCPSGSKTTLRIRTIRRKLKDMTLFRHGE